ncbi:MAG: glycosyltransferase [Paludibacteraceae bacterium]|nr:glycosyltransferase [Paludibacteraceae bacterium]
MKTIRIKFVDFFSSFRPETDPLWQRLQQFYQVEISDKPDWLVYSVFGSEHLQYNNCVKIFYTGENQAPDFNLCDYALGFDYIDFGDRYLRLPLWVLYSKDTALMTTKHLQPSLRAKDSFCSFVYSNSNASPERGEMLEALNGYKTVNSGGRYRNNVGGPVADKLAFQQKHKFAIAFENASHEGYTTEKLVQAFAAGTVPIYWGDPRVGETFNEDAFINCLHYPDWEAVVKRVKEIDEDDALWLKMVQTPALREADTVEKLLDSIDQFLQHIFDQEPKAARRFSRDYWALKQLHQRQRERRAYERSLMGRMQAFTNRYIFPFARKHEKLWLAFKSLAKKLNM